MRYLYNFLTRLDRVNQDRRKVMGRLAYLLALHARIQARGYTQRETSRMYEPLDATRDRRA